jgi:uncharacterized protein
MSSKTPKRIANEIVLGRSRALLTFLGLGCVALVIWLSQLSASVSQVTLKGRVFSVEIADTKLARERGLSERESLDPDWGMLFVYEQPEQSCFWMKDTEIPLDILWFDDQLKLVDVKERVLPESYPAQFCSENAALYVLELNAGMARALQLQSGDKLELDL